MTTVDYDFHTLVGTYYIQNINVTSNDIVPGQIDIDCNFLVNSTEVMGYMAIVYSGESSIIRYLVAENNNQGFVKRVLTNLTSDTYITSLYALNQTGLPMRQAADFPQRVSVEMPRTGMIIIIENVGPLYIPEEIYSFPFSWFSDNDPCTCLSSDINYTDGKIYCHSDRYSI